MAPGKLAYPRAILFDLDGTLVDSIELIVRSFQHTTKEHLGTPLPRDQILPTIGLPLSVELERLAPGRGAALLATYRDYFHAHHDALATLFPGVEDLLVGLCACRGVPGFATGVVTSKARGSAARSLSLLRRPYIDLSVV